MKRRRAVTARNLIISRAIPFECRFWNEAAVWRQGPRCLGRKFSLNTSLVLPASTDETQRRPDGGESPGHELIVPRPRIKARSRWVRIRRHGANSIQKAARRNLAVIAA
jgi:hypothetical protein